MEEETAGGARLALGLMSLSALGVAVSLALGLTYGWLLALDGLAIVCVLMTVTVLGLAAAGQRSPNGARVHHTHARRVLPRVRLGPEAKRE
jgi:hypothetical protein